MKKALMAFSAAAMLSAATAPNSARANDGQVAAGIFGGLFAGTLLGAAIASPRPYYYAPTPYYYGPAYYGPVYGAPPPVRCYWTRGTPVWDEWRGVWIRPRVQVCD